MSNYFANTESVGIFGNIKSYAATHADDIQIYFPSAKKDMIRLVGEKKYNEVIDKLGEDPTHDDVIIFKQAESFFVIARLIPKLNIVSTGAGVTKAEGFGDGRKELLTENDIDSVVKRYRDDAELLLQDYIIITDEDDEEVENILIKGGLGVIAP